MAHDRRNRITFLTSINMSANFGSHSIYNKMIHPQTDQSNNLCSWCFRNNHGFRSYSGMCTHHCQQVFATITNIMFLIEFPQSVVGKTIRIVTTLKYPDCFIIVDAILAKHVISSLTLFTFITNSQHKSSLW